MHIGSWTKESKLEGEDTKHYTIKYYNKQKTPLKGQNCHVCIQILDSLFRNLKELLNQIDPIQNRQTKLASRRL